MGTRGQLGFDGAGKGETENLKIPVPSRLVFSTPGAKATGLSLNWLALILAHSTSSLDTSLFTQGFGAGGQVTGRHSARAKHGSANGPRPKAVPHVAG